MSYGHNYGLDEAARESSLPLALCYCAAVLH